MAAESPVRSRGRKPVQSGRIRERIREMIASGALRPGQALPTEVALAAALGASQPTVNRELRRLTADGVLAFGASGERIVAGRSRGLLGRTVVLCTAFASPAPAGGKILEAWEPNLEVLADTRIQDHGLLTWRVPAARLAERELALLGVDGPCLAVLFAAGLDPALTAALHQGLSASGMPLVVHGDAEDHPGADTVDSDHAAGGAAVAAWLLEHGCVRLVRQQEAGARPGWFARRCVGTDAALLAAGQARPAVLVQPPGIAGAKDDARFAAEVTLMTEALRPHVAGPLPLGILAMSDGEVPRIWAAVRRLGLEPGRDVLLAGYDGYWADLMERRFEPTPPSVSLDKGHRLQAEVLAEVVDRRLRERSAPLLHRLVQPTLTG